MVIHEVHVKRKPNINDPRGDDIAKEAQRALGISTSIRTTNVFRVEGGNLSGVTELAKKAFIDPIVEIGEIDPDTKGTSSPSIEVAYRPEVTDPISGTILKVAADLKIPIDAARASTKYEFEGVSREQVSQIAERLLVNDKVQEIITEKPQTLK